MKVRTERGKTFDAVQWTGVPDTLPAWAQAYPIETLRYYGPVLCVGPYYVKPTSWLLRGDERGDVFPVPADMFENIYTPANEVGA